MQLGRCVEKRETEAEVDKSMAEGKSLGVNSTPTIFVNGRKLGNTPWPQLKRIIDLEIEVGPLHDDEPIARGLHDLQRELKRRCLGEGLIAGNDAAGSVRHNRAGRTEFGQRVGERLLTA